MTSTWPDYDKLETPFVQMCDEGLIISEDIDLGERRLLHSLEPLLRGWDPYRWKISLGVGGGPSFGFFDMAGRFWRASLCIFFAGRCDCFYERGTGYGEPWLYVARHSIELFLKGYLFFADWLEKVQKNLLTPGDNPIRNRINKHNLCELYNEYRSKIVDVYDAWPKEELPELSDRKKLLLSEAGEKILLEISEADVTGERFRYPAIGKKTKGSEKQCDEIQKMGFEHDDSCLFPITGLPRKHGVLFDSTKVINSLHRLVRSHLKKTEVVF